MANAALVVEALHAREGASDGVGIVAVWIVAMPAEPRLDTLYLPRRRVSHYPVGSHIRLSSIHECHIR